MARSFTEAELWAQALAIEELLGDRALEWLGRTAVELHAAGDARGVRWMRDMHVRVELLSAARRRT